MFDILNNTDAGRRFIDEWFDETPSVTAHTSGSTGVPKEIRLQKSDMRLSARATIRKFNLTAESRILSPLSADYIAGKMMIVRAIEADCHITMEDPSNRPLHGHSDPVDLMAVVPSQCIDLVGNRNAGHLLKNLIVGGAPLSADMETSLMRMPWKSFATYGMTETCSHVALRQLGQEIYEAMPGISFSCDDRSCLTINAPGFSFGQLQTNDIADLIDSTHFRWRGRADNVINSGGIKLFPEELERMLEGKLAVPFYITGVKSEKWGECVELVLETDDDTDKAEIIKICAASLPPYAIPRHIRFMPTLPRTSNGKIKRL